MDRKCTHGAIRRSPGPNPNAAALDIRRKKLSVSKKPRSATPGLLALRLLRICLAGAVAAAWLAASEQAGTAGASLEYQIKAAYLYNFAKFVEWPDRPGDPLGPLTICIVGKDPFGPVLDETFRGKTIEGRPVVIRRGTTFAAVKPCQILFVSSSEKKRLSQVLQGLRGETALTVGETDGFAKEGGMVDFLNQENKIHLEINPEAASRAGIRISSKLLRLARVVHSANGEP